MENSPSADVAPLTELDPHPIPLYKCTYKNGKTESEKAQTAAAERPCFQKQAPPVKKLSLCFLRADLGRRRNWTSLKVLQS